jgi:hypothetical protein
MLSASSIMSKLSVVALLLTASTTTFSQENSPYSRYGLGDLYPHQSIASRAMGGITAGFLDGQALNTANPASYGSIRYVTYDLGISVDSRTLKSAKPIASYRSTNFIPSYVQLGVPLTQRRDFGLVFGLKPLTRVNYSIETRSRIAVDSLLTVNEGSGGLNEVFIGLGKRWKNFSIGFNTGYDFGRKEIGTRVELINDTVSYMRGIRSNVTTFGAAFFEGGFQYLFSVGKVEHKATKTTDAYFVRVGGTASLKRNLSGDQQQSDETFFYDANGGTVKLDSVRVVKGIKGKITVPAKYNAGFTLSKVVSDQQGTVDRWSVGADFTMQNWGSDYSFYGQKDQVVNSYMLNIGGQIIPNALNATSYWSRVTYRAGFYTGKDYLNPDGQGLKVYGVTFGAGFPIRKWRAYDNQFSLINTAVEVGKRGSGVNNITEGFLKVSVGLSLSDVWFIKRRYD